MTDCNLEFARGGAEFMVDLCDKLNAGTSGENIIVSPFSIQTCMALVFAGAKGETANEIAAALKYKSNSCSDVAKTFNYVLNQYKDSPLLKIANKVCVQQGYALKADYSAITKEQFNASAEEINFSANVEAASNINKWCSDNTAGKISKIVEPSLFNSLTRLVLLNAIHFKGDWMKKFKSNKTKSDDFWLNGKDSIKVKYMNQKAHFNYGYFHDYKCKGLEMAYKDSDLSMFVLLPDERDGLPALLEALKTANLLDFSSKMCNIEVTVKFPKFKVDYKVTLNEVLKKMGVKLAFGSADLSNMLESPAALTVCKVLHKASIEVNEEGTEAAAAAAAIIVERCMPRTYKFEADHPFIYWIWNKKNILFAGTFMGVKLAFGPADLSNMLESREPLSVSTVLHKACIEVNEEGTEAAAVTAAVIVSRCAPRVYKFEADHPFVYWIWNKKNILFAGTFVNAPKED